MSLVSWYVLPEGYTASYSRCADGIYWHLFCGGERVNGGIGEDYVDAQDTAARYARLHCHRNDPASDDDFDLDLLMDRVARERRRRERHP